MTAAKISDLEKRLRVIRIGCWIALFVFEGLIGYLTTVQIDWTAVGYTLMKAYAVYAIVAFVTASSAVAYTMIVYRPERKEGAG
jgi:hypothetical protein